MGQSFLSKLWRLVGLRYRLIWAQARKSHGRIALLFLVYLFGVGGALLMSFAGAGVALADAAVEQSGFLARWLLLGFFVNGIGMSLVFGVATRDAFSDAALRRYPLNGRERFAVRQLIGLLDPIWLILFCGTVGVAFGFWYFQVGWLALSLPAAVLFIAASYLTTAVLLALVGLMMQTRRGAALLGLLLILLISGGPVVLSFVVSAPDRPLWPLADGLLRYAPPGITATLMTTKSLTLAGKQAALLLGWCALLLLLLKRLESKPPIAAAASAGGLVWDGPLDQIAKLFRPPFAPLVAKSLRYHLRCNIIRFSLFTSPLLVLLGKFLLFGREVSNGWTVTFGLFFITSAATGAAMMLNLFGFEDAGIRRYAILPAPMVTALRVGSVVSLALRAVTMFFALALWTLLSGARPTLPLLLTLLCVITVSLLVYNGLGLWTSVLSPKRANFESMWNNRLSLGGNLVMIGGVFLPYALAFVVAGRLKAETVKGLWWLGVVAIIFSAAFFVFSLKAIEPILRARRERLINLIAGASSN